VPSHIQLTSRHNSTWIERLDRLRAAAGNHKRSFASSLLNTSQGAVWKLFAKQDFAFEFMKTRFESVHLFSFEKPGSGEGQRRFVVATYESFWENYSIMGAEHRHFYEVIAESAPCHLYFDLEYQNEENPSRNPRDMMALFIFLVCEKLQECFQVQCDPTHILQLDSSTEKKFSMHAIVHIPGCAFRTNAHAGSFVSYLIASIHQDARYAPIIITTKGTPSTFIDPAVYSKNRNFRLVQSSKLGKPAILQVASENQFDLARWLVDSGALPQETADCHLFFASLVCYTPFAACARLLSFDGHQGSARVPHRAPARGPDTPTVGAALSPFPDIDQFVVASLACRGGTQGRIRRYVYSPIRL
jgi:hypothetical protein